MVLFNIYLGTVFSSIVLVGMFAVACEERLKREGYKIVKKEESTIERLLKLIRIFISLAIPVYNIILDLGIVFFNDKIYENCKEKLLEDGFIRKPLENDNKEEIVMDQEIDTKEESNNINKYVKRSYNDLTIDEQLKYLEIEKERLQKIKNNNDIQDGQVLKKQYKESTY